ncbi:MAG: flagellar biosynthesis anti-sigma factor FlgM [Sphingomonadales bacterium]
MIDNVRMTAVVPIAAGTAGKADTARATAATPTQQTPAPAPTAPSPSLSRLISLANDLSSAPAPVDYAKIAQVRRAIADGSYKVDPDALAKSIVAYVSARK